MSLIGYSKMRGKHALFSPSSVYWIHYSDEKFIEALRNYYRSDIGTEIHDWAAIQITLGLKCVSVRDMAKSIKTMIFKKYYDEVYGISDFGQTLLFHLKFIPNDVYAAVKEYVNDSISNLMVPEECEEKLDYSEFFSGTCDALYFDEKDRVLRIFDLKTGSRPGKIEQLYIYAALFCLRNKVEPDKITFDLRIYQRDGMIIGEENTNQIVKDIADKISHFDKLARKHGKGGIL